MQHVTVCLMIPSHVALSAARFYGLSAIKTEPNRALKFHLVPRQVLLWPNTNLSIVNKIENRYYPD